ncbi:MAG TPA: ABC transporter permease [Bryobacteraceae bacterium]|nr:ABC transporter permease [Bryobacteraceae bacterium]
MRRRDDWDEEMESHIAMRAELLERNGMTPEEARRKAERAFGNRARIGESVRAVHVPEWLDQLRQDLRYAWRGLLHSPGFTVTALAALAVGIGASTAVFSLADRILFRPLPYAQEKDLVWFGMAAPIADSEFLLTWDYDMWRKKQTPFQTMAASSGTNDCDLTADDPVRLRCAAVEPGFLGLFGMAPIIGRDFSAADGQFGAPQTALISHGMWRTRFGANPGVLEQTVELEGRPVRIIGVLPPNFELPSLAELDILRPLQWDPKERGAGFLHVFARLKPGVTVAEARARLEPLFQESLRSIPSAFAKDIRFSVSALRDRQVRDTRQAVLLLLGAVGLVLLIAIANVANLLLARAASRQREIAVRAALGADAARLFRQTLTEGLLLSLLGGVGGLAFAAFLLRLFTVMAPAGMARLDQATLDARVLAMTFGVSLLVGLLFGNTPAMRRFGTDSLTGGRVAGPRRQWLRPALVMMQISLSLVLLCGAGLLLHSLWKLANVPLGIRTDNLMAVQAQLPRQRYPERAQMLAFWEAIEERVAALPGVTRFAVTNSLPPAGKAMAAVYASLEVDGRGRMAADGVGGMVVIRQVTHGYFGALRIPMEKGRTFTEEDRRRPDSVVILDRTLAARMFPNENPIGRRIKSGDTGWMEVVGVAGNVRNAGLQQAPDPEFYMAKRHNPADGRLANTVIFSAPAAIVPLIREEFRRLDPRLTVQIDTLDERVSKLQARPRFQTLLLGGFAGAGLLLAGIGLYGVIALLVTQRTAEIGIRMALGATPGDVRSMVLRQAGGWLAAGVMVGLAAATASRKLLESLLFGTAPDAPGPVVLAVVTLSAAALLAGWLPARRAARIEPVRALRYE